jgi:uncharacterized repeat protein (TIGR02543 family)
MSRTNLYSGNSSAYTSFSANAGDVIYISLYKYSSSGATGYGTVYVTGASYPTSTATVSCGVVDGFVYDSSSSVSTTVVFGSDYTLPTPTREGYTFLGWYNGDTKVESGVWDLPNDVILTARWE